MKRIYFSLRNLLLYREPRNLPRSFLRDMSAAKTLDDGKLAMTDGMLFGYGLRVVETEGQLDGIYLTRRQRECVALVGQYGYRVGPRENGDCYNPEFIIGDSIHVFAECPIPSRRIPPRHRAPIAERPTLLAGERDSARRIAADLRDLLAKHRPTSYAENEFLGRLAMDLEELAEWAEAHASGDLIAAADAWGDRMYVLLGDAVTTGLPAETIFAEIHRSNMTKSEPSVSSDGKGRKREAFMRPQLAGLLKAENDSRSDCQALGEVVRTIATASDDRDAATHAYGGTVGRE